jgi:hypothetical protein
VLDRVSGGRTMMGTDRPRITLLYLPATGPDALRNHIPTHRPNALIATAEV